MSNLIPGRGSGLVGKLQVIAGGQAPNDPIAIETKLADLLDRARRIEAGAITAAQLAVPAAAVASKSDAELTQMIAAAGLAEAIRTHAALKDAADAAGALFDTLKTAKAKLLASITAVAREGSAGTTNE